MPPPPPTVAARLSRLVREAVTTYGHDRIELEWRLGHRQGSFRPGVGVDAWRRLQTALDASPHFQKTYRDTVEKMGDVAGIKCIDEFTTGTQVWMHKTRLGDVDVDPTGDSQRPWSQRASVSLEEVESTPAQVALKYERKKQRWSYRHECWSIDLTKVQSNLPSHLDEDQDCFEVEIELVDQGILFERPLDHVVQWGWRLADDMCRLMAGSSPAP